MSPKPFIVITDRSSKSNGKNGAANMRLKRVLPIPLILVIKARLNVAFKTLIGSS